MKNKNINSSLQNENISKLIKYTPVLILIVMLYFSVLFYLNLRHNYVAMMSSLNSCRMAAFSTNTESNDSTMGYGKFCSMDGDPESYNFYLSHPFDKALVKEGVDGYSAKITGSFIDTF